MPNANHRAQQGYTPTKNFTCPCGCRRKGFCKRHWKLLMEIRESLPKGPKHLQKKRERAGETKQERERAS